MIVSAVWKLPCAPNSRPNDTAVASVARQSTFCSASATPAGPVRAKGLRTGSFGRFQPVIVVARRRARPGRAGQQRIPERRIVADRRADLVEPADAGFAARQDRQQVGHAAEVEPDDDRAVRLPHEEAAAVRRQRCG